MEGAQDFDLSRRNQTFGSNFMLGNLDPDLCYVTSNSSIIPIVASGSWPQTFDDTCIFCCLNYCESMTVIDMGLVNYVDNRKNCSKAMQMVKTLIYCNLHNVPL